MAKKQLSKNFSLDELVQSDLVDKLNSDSNPNNDIVNTPSLAEEANLDALADNILQPLRDYLGYEVEINSGFRGEKLNKLQGGVPTSQHRKGQAADIRCKEMRRAFIYIQNYLPFDQLLWEEGNDCKPAWIHVSYSDRNRRQVLRFQNGKYTKFKAI